METLQGIKAKRLTTAGAPGKAPLPGRLAPSPFSFAHARNNRVAMHEPLRYGSPDFQTCRIADSPKSAGRKAALEVGLEICATSDEQ